MNAMLRGAMRLLAVLGVAAAAGWTGLQWWGGHALTFTHDKVHATVKPNASVHEAAEAWVRAGVDTNPWLLAQWFRLAGDARRIRAGAYTLEGPVSPQQLFEKMLRGGDSQGIIRFTEGWTFRQMRQALDKAEDLKVTTTGMTDGEVMAALGQPGEKPEGRFFPDTYHYQRGSTDLAVLKESYRAMTQQLDAAWARRDPASPLKTPYEALILASVIEKETGRPEDRGLVAGVFNNRLRIGMPLQTDPTVIYGLGEKFDGNLRKVDLVTDGPYNTYLHRGLPPTPIAMPGKQSLMDAVAPAPTQALYFVARGDGTSEFSTNLDDHNRAVNRFQRGAQGKP